MLVTEKVAIFYRTDEVGIKKAIRAEQIKAGVPGKRAARATAEQIKAEICAFTR